MHRFTLVAAGCLVAFIGYACSLEPDGDSGGDEDRHIAKDMPLGDPWQGEFSWPDGDRTDWMRFFVQDGGLLRMQVSFANKDTGADVQVFNSYGKAITKEFVKRPGIEEQINVEQMIGPGRYFVRVRGHEEGDRSEYSLRVIVQ